MTLKGALSIFVKPLILNLETPFRRLNIFVCTCGSINRKIVPVVSAKVGTVSHLIFFSISTKLPYGYSHTADLHHCKTGTMPSIYCNIGNDKVQSFYGNTWATRMHEIGPIISSIIERQNNSLVAKGSPYNCPTYFSGQKKCHILHSADCSLILGRNGQ